MLLSLTNIARVIATDVRQHQHCHRYEIVRFYKQRRSSPWGHVRKPMWLGTAKTKLTRLPVYFPYREGELKELTKLYNNYKCSMKSIFQHFKDEYDKVSDVSAFALEIQKAEEEEHLRLMERNNIENERLRKLRDARVEKELEVKADRLRIAFSEREEQFKVQLEKVEKIVREEKEKAKSFITPENLDEAIDRALSTEVDYNFAIDLDGNVYKGRATRPDTQDADRVKKMRPVADSY